MKTGMKTRSGQNSKRGSERNPSFFARGSRKRRVGIGLSMTFCALAAISFLMGEERSTASHAAERDREPALKFQNPEEFGTLITRAPETLQRGAGKRGGLGSSLAAMGGSHRSRVTKSSRDFQDGWIQSTERMRNLVECAASEACPFPKDQPYSYDLAVHTALALEIRRFNQLVRSRTDASGFPESAAGIARYFLAASNDDVKEAALELIALAPPSEANMESVIDALRKSVSAPLYRKGFDELRRYAGEDQPPELDQFIREVVVRGPHFASIEAARATLSFMNPGNVEDYIKFTRELPVRSKTRFFMELNLQEYERLRTGG